MKIEIPWSGYTTSSPPFVLRDSRASETRARVKITPRKKRPPTASRFSRVGVIFTRARVSLALLSPGRNGELLVVYDQGDLFWQRSSIEMSAFKSLKFYRRKKNVASPPPSPTSPYDTANKVSFKTSPIDSCQRHGQFTKCIQVGNIMYTFYKAHNPYLNNKEIFPVINRGNFCASTLIKVIVCVAISFKVQFTCCKENKSLNTVFV